MLGRLAAFGGGAAAAACVGAASLDADGDAYATLYARLVAPALRLIDAESAHRLGILAARARVLPTQRAADDAVLATTLWGKRAPNPIGLAAGFDKDAEAVDGLFSIGFGLVEVGSITPRPQPGNPKPRVFRLPEDGAVINRYGFNSAGHEAAGRHLAARHAAGGAVQLGAAACEAGGGAVATASRGLLGVNLGKNKTTPEADAADDYVAGVRALGRHADYLVVNVSSPNTPGLRDLQRREALGALLRHVRTRS